MATYLYTLKGERPTFPEDATQEELDWMGRHFEYLQGLLAEGKLHMAGRCQDPGGFVIVIFEAESDEAAQAIVEADPCVPALRGVIRAELHPYRIALWRS